jgi:rhodanese-related sulfurtransferase
MKRTIIYTFLFISGFVFSQQTLSEVLKKHNNEDIPYISVQELAMPKTDAILLDARELKEYEVSHLKDALYVGYNEFNLEHTVKHLNNKDQMIVVYCSLGIRSEDIAEQLQNKGYTNVYNLFGGIFEWKNKGFSVYDNNKNPTENVHAFSKEWSQWLLKGIKIYD